jgi:hypothetical protein
MYSQVLLYYSTTLLGPEDSADSARPPSFTCVDFMVLFLKPFFFSHEVSQKESSYPFSSNNKSSLVMHTIWGITHRTYTHLVHTYTYTHTHIVQTGY